MSFDLPRHLLFPGQAHEMAFRLIPPGTFWMGSRGRDADEEPRHRVHITEPFWMAETPVTQAQYALAGVGSPSHFKDRPDHPVDRVSWLDAVRYADWLTRSAAGDFPSGFALACLPTEAEWEYACRAGTETEYWSGDGEAALAEVAWYGEEWESGSTHPVRAKQRPNPFGLHDMHGNVWEWCHDPFVEGAYRDQWEGIPDPGYQERETDYQTEAVLNGNENTARVLRGGSWFNTARDCRSAIRVGFGAGDRVGLSGFRLCLLPGPVAASPEQERSGAQGGRRGDWKEPEPTDQGGAGIDLSAERAPGPKEPA